MSTRGEFQIGRSWTRYRADSKLQVVGGAAVGCVTIGCAAIGCMAVGCMAVGGAAVGCMTVGGTAVGGAAVGDAAEVRLKCLKLLALQDQSDMMMTECGTLHT